MATAGQMKATLGLDVSQFETRARDAANTAKQMGSQISRALDGSKVSARAQAGAFDQLRASVDPAFAAAQRYGQMQRQVAGYVEAGVVSQRAANMVLEQAASKYLGVATAAERAEAAQRDHAHAVALSKQSYDALRMSIDPLYASSKRYEQAQETLTAAVAAGIIKQGEANRVLQMANQRYLAVAPAATAATSGLNKFTPAITSAGFQVQDFAVQVASGQSAMTAFAQQFPQLMGVLGFSGKLALAGTMIGTFAAVAFAVAPMLFDIGDAARKTSETVADLSSALQSYQEYAAKARGTSAELFAEFGMGAARGRELYEALALLERIKFDQNLSASIKSLTGDLKGVTDMIAQWDYATLQLPPALRAETIYLSQEAVQKLGAEYGLTLGQARQVTNAMSDLSMAAGPEQAAIASKNLAQSLLSAHAAGAKLPPELVEAARSAAETGVAAERMNAILNSSVGLGTSMSSEFDQLAASIGYAAAMAMQLAAQLGAAAVSGAKEAERQLAVINAQIAAVKGGQNEVIAGKVKALDLDKAAYRTAMANAGMSAALVEESVKKNFSAREAVIYAEQERDALIQVRTETERAAKGGSGGKSKAAKESEKLSSALDKEAEKWLDTIDPMNKYRREMGELLKLQGRLSEEDMAKAMKKLNGDLADSIPMVGDLADAWADFVVSGGKDIEGLGDLFKGVLKQMIADAAKTQIMVAMGFAPSGTAGVTGSTGAAGSAGGALSGFGSVFAKDGWLMTGLNSGKGILGTIGGWLGMGGQAAGTAGAAGGIMGSLGSLGSMLGTAGAIIGGIGMVISLGKKLFGRELKDTGLQGTFSGSGFEGSTYKYYKGGLLRSNKTTTEALDPAVQQTIGMAYGDLRKSVKGMAGVLGLGTDAIKKFAYEFKISTKDMTEEQALEALQAEMAKAGAGMADLILGTKKYTEAGETALDTLTRLSSSLTAVRQVADTLGHSFDLIGLRGGDVASHLAKAFGGIEAMGSAVQSYWQVFYTDSERIRTLTRQTSQQLAKLGVSMPRSRAEYRALIESIDLTDKKSHKLYATLIGLSGVMDEILPTITGMTRELERLQGKFVTAMGKVASGLEAAISANQAAAGDWRKAGEGIRAFLDKLYGTASAVVSAQQARSYNQMKYMTTLASARAGDVTAAGNLSGVAGTYLDSVNATAKTRLEAARAQARVAAALGNFADRTETQAQKLDRIADIQGRQLALIERMQALIDAGKTISEEQLSVLRTQLGDLDSKILRVNVTGFEGAATLLPKVQMQGLRTALDDLRDAIRAETARQKHEAAVAKLNAFVGNLTTNKAGQTFVDDADLARMAKMVGLNTEGMNTGQIRSALVNFDGGDKLKGTIYDPTGSKEQAYLDSLRGGGTADPRSKDPFEGFRLGYGWRGSGSGTWHQTVLGPLGGARVFDVGTSSVGVEDWFKEMIAKKKFPAFARGGTHMGGPAYVGENDLELVAPSRIYSPQETRSMLDNREVVKELRAMRQEMAQMREENRQLGLAVADNTRKMQRTIQKWDQTAVPTQEVTP